MCINCTIAIFRLHASGAKLFANNTFFAVVWNIFLIGLTIETLRFRKHARWPCFDFNHIMILFWFLKFLWRINLFRSIPYFGFCVLAASIYNLLSGCTIWGILCTCFEVLCLVFLFYVAEWFAPLCDYLQSATSYANFL